MKISVITPVYNAKEYIGKAVHSILGQSYKDFELILIDDGSKDGSGIICDDFARKDQRIKAIHQENKGVSAARNVGLEQAVGEWICFLDSDDEVTSEWLQSYVDAIEEGIDIIFQGAKIVNKGKEAVFKLKDEVYTRDNLVNLISLWQNGMGHIGSAWSKMFKASILKENNVTFDETIHNYEDWIFLTYALSHANRVRTISGMNYVYNHIHSSLTGGKTNWNASQRLSILTARYEAAFSLRTINEKCFQVYIADISKLIIQALYKVYKEKYPQKQRMVVLERLKRYPINISTMNVKERFLNLIWIKACNNLSDSLFSICCRL